MTIPSIDGKKLSDFERFARDRQKTADTARLRDAWRMMANATAMHAREVAEHERQKVQAAMSENRAAAQ